MKALYFITLLLGGAAFAQSPAPAAAPRAFDVVSIKPAAGDARSWSGFRREPGGLFLARDVPASSLIAFGYPAFELVGLPAWTRSERYDVDAKASPDATRDDVSEMMRSVLKDRFGLLSHYEQRTMGRLALAVGKSGPRMARIDADCSETRPDAQMPLLRGPADALPACMIIFDGAMLNSGGMNMDRLTKQLGAILHGPVVDGTKLDGYYRFVLKFTTPGAQTTLSPDEYPELSTALAEQLGLTLKSTKSTVDVLVVDAVTHPQAD